MDNNNALDQNQTGAGLNSLFSQLFLAMFLLGILPLGFVIVSEYQKGRDRIFEEQHILLEESNRQVIRSLNLYLDSIATSLEVESAIARQMLFHLIQSRAAQEQEDRKEFTQSFSYGLISNQYQSEFEKYINAYQLPGFAIVDKEGNILFALGAESHLLGESLNSEHLSKTELSGALKKSQSSLLNSFTAPEKLDRRNDSALSRLIKPVINDKQEVLGFIYVSLSPEKLSGFFRVSEQYAGIRAYLLTKEGIIQYGSDIGEHQYMQILSTNPDAKRNVHEVGDHDHEHDHDQDHSSDLVHEYKNFAGQTVFGDVHALRLQNTPMKFLVEMEVAETLAPLNAFRDRLFQLIGLMILAVLVMTYLITRRVVTPIGALNQRVVEVRNGNYEARDIISGYPEVVSLSQNIEYMTSEIKKLLDENDEQNWYQQGLVQLNDAIRGNLWVQALTTKILTSIVHYLDFKVGAFYLSDGSGYLDLTASYAGIKEALAERIAFGEGMTGQAAVDQTIQEFNHPKGEGLIVASASGSTAPEVVVNVPVVYEGQTLGVMVFGQFQPLTKKQSRFIESCLLSIAMALHAAIQSEALKNSQSGYPSVAD